MEFRPSNILYYKSSKLKPNKEGKKEPHYHILIKEYGKVWFQVICTSRKIEENHSNVFMLDPKDCSVFKKTTRINCDNILEIQKSEFKDEPNKGNLIPSLFNNLKGQIIKSKKVKRYIKKELEN